MVCTPMCLIFLLLFKDVFEKLLHVMVIVPIHCCLVFYTMTTAQIFHFAVVGFQFGTTVINILY